MCVCDKETQRFHHNGNQALLDNYSHFNQFREDMVQRLQLNYMLYHRKEKPTNPFLSTSQEKTTCVQHSRRGGSNISHKKHAGPSVRVLNSQHTLFHFAGPLKNMSKFICETSVRRPDSLGPASFTFAE